MAQLVLCAKLDANRRGVAASNDDRRSRLLGSNAGLETRLGALVKRGELEHAGGAVPENRLGLEDGRLEQLLGLVARVETHPLGRDPGSVRRVADLLRSRQLGSGEGGRTSALGENLSPVT